MRERFPELVIKPERHHRQPRIIDRRITIVQYKTPHATHDLHPCVAVTPGVPLPVDVAQANIPPARLERLGQDPGVLQRITHDIPVPFMTEMDEVEVLREYLGTRP